VSQMTMDLICTS